LNSVPKFAQKISLPSPINNSEDEAKEPEIVLSRNVSEKRDSSRKLSRKNSKRKFSVVLFKQFMNDEKFIFRTSNQSDVILKHDEKYNDGCYINLSHCHFYPDPDNERLMLRKLVQLAYQNTPDLKSKEEPLRNLLIQYAAWNFEELALMKKFQDLLIVGRTFVNDLCQKICQRL
jgi:hypothetical protein